MEQTARDSVMTAEGVEELAVRCFVLPLHGMSLLVPNTLVAEVIEYKPSEAISHMPDWMLGLLSWRGQNVPLISFERLLGKDVSTRNEERRYVVFNTLSGNPRLPFIAMEIQGIPHLLMVKNEMLERVDRNQQHEPAILDHLRLNEESVIVPNIDVMEKMLEHLGIAAG